MSTTCERPGCLNAEHHDLSGGDFPVRIDGPRPACAVCGDEATHTVGSRSLCPDHAAEV